MRQKIMGWTHPQWSMAIEFFDAKHETMRFDFMEDYMLVRMFWWQHWHNAPSALQVTFVALKRSHVEAADYLFNVLEKRHTMS